MDVHDTNELTHVYCYWSEDRSKLEGDEPPSGEGVFLLDLGANTGTALSSKTTFTVPATEGLERNRTYYFRLASGDDQGIELFPSDEIVELNTEETPITVLNNATWDNSNVATVNFTAIVGTLDPEETQLVALYSRVQGDVTGKDPETKESVTTVSLGYCSDLGLDTESPSATFPSALRSRRTSSSRYLTASSRTSSRSRKAYSRRTSSRLRRMLSQTSPSSAARIRRRQGWSPYPPSSRARSSTS